MVWLIAKTVISMTILCTLMYGCACVLKKITGASNMSGTSPGVFEVVTTCQIRPKNALYIIRIMNHYYLFSCTETTTEMICMLQGEELEQYISDSVSNRVRGRSGLLFTLLRRKK